MIKKEITICSKQVTLAYCYATEIAYKDLSDEDMFDYAQAAVEAIQAQRDPDIKKTILAIIACMMAYYEDADKAPVKDSEIMKQATPVEIGTAMLTILIRAVLLYFILTLSMRAMGKRQLGQFQPYEFVMAMLIANLIASPMSDISTPLLHGVLPVAALYGAHALITLLCMRSD